MALRRAVASVLLRPRAATHPSRVFFGPRTFTFAHAPAITALRPLAASPSQFDRVALPLGALVGAAVVGITGVVVARAEGAAAPAAEVAREAEKLYSSDPLVSRGKGAGKETRWRLQTVRLALNSHTGHAA